MHEKTGSLDIACNWACDCGRSCSCNSWSICKFFKWYCKRLLNSISIGYSVGNCTWFDTKFWSSTLSLQDAYHATVETTKFLSMPWFYITFSGKDASAWVLTIAYFMDRPLSIILTVLWTHRAAAYEVLPVPEWTQGHWFSRATKCWSVDQTFFNYYPRLTYSNRISHFMLYSILFLQHRILCVKHQHLFENIFFYLHHFENILYFCFLFNPVLVYVRLFRG